MLNCMISHPSNHEKLISKIEYPFNAQKLQLGSYRDNRASKLPDDLS